jgi:predicted porin
MRKILLGTTAVVGAALIGAGVAQAQTPPPAPMMMQPGSPNVFAQPGAGFQVRLGGYFAFYGYWANDDLDKASGPNTFTGAIGTNAIDSANRPFVSGTGVVTGETNAVRDARIAAGSGNLSRRSWDFRSDFEIHVSGSGKMANGISYGFVIELQNDNVGDGNGGGIDSDEAWMFFSSPTLGTLRLGDEDNAPNLMRVGAPNISVISPTDFGNPLIVNRNANSNGPVIVTNINDGNDATKIVYLSPQFFGFDFGLSYAPNNGEASRPFVGGGGVDILNTFTPLGAGRGQRDGLNQDNQIAGAIRYRGSFNNVGVGAFFGAQRADGARVNTTTGQGITTRDITAYSVGAQISAFGFAFGGEYTWGNYSGTAGRGALAAGRNASNTWQLGLTYTTGPWQLGAFYGQATQDNGTSVTVAASSAAGGTVTIANPGDRVQTVWGFGVAYTLTPGLELFASYGRLNDDNVYITQALQNRNADVVFFGSRIAF